jgi:hypothetical protein
MYSTKIIQLIDIYMLKIDLVFGIGESNIIKIGAWSNSWPVTREPPSGSKSRLKYLDPKITYGALYRREILANE